MTYYWSLDIKFLVIKTPLIFLTANINDNLPVSASKPQHLNLYQKKRFVKTNLETFGDN